MKKEAEVGPRQKSEAESKEAFDPQNERASTLKRIDGRYILDEIISVLYFDKGILYTIKGLLLRPGNTVREFLLKDRSRVVKPVIFLIITSLIYSFLRQFVSFQDGYIYHDSSVQSTPMNIFQWVQNNYGYGNLIIGVFIALWTKALFRKHDYNYYEILILQCFVVGFGMLILATFGTLEGLTGIKFLQYGGMSFIIYSAWAIGQFFDRTKISSYWKAFLAYLLGMITFTIGVYVVGGFIDLIM